MLLIVIFAVQSCNQTKKTNENQTQVESIENTTPNKPLVEKTLTKAEQDKLTPDEVIQSFKDGNQRFMNNTLTVRDHSKQVRNATSGQFPKAVILSCLDSRVPVEDVFDKGIGDLFVARVAGNFVNEDILGSMEFACKVAGAKVILVMAHEHCGAVKAAIDDVKLGNISAMLQKIKPAVKLSQTFNGDKTSKNNIFVDSVAINNVKYNIDVIRKKSAILKEMEDSGFIKIVGTYYDLDNGEVKFL